MIYKYISLKNIVEKLYRDYETNESYDIDDLVEWAGEALRKINAPQQYKYNLSKIDIENYKGILPCNFHHVLQVYYEGVALKYNTGTLGLSTTAVPNRLVPLYNKPVSAGISGADIIIDDLEALGYDVTGELENLLKGTFSLYSNVVYSESYSYEIYDNYLYTSFEEGEVYLIYKGIPVDDEGYPKIPDNVYYEEAIASYLQYRIDYRDWRSGRISDKVYAESKANWLKYVRSARAAGITPNLDVLEGIRKMWVKLIPNETANKTFFNNMNIQENLRKQ